MLFICYPKCTTCQRAKKFLDEKGIKYEERNIKEQNPSADELKKWIAESGLPIKKFFNTSGMLYRSMQLAERLPDMTDEEKLDLLASDGMLVKRPIVVEGKTVLVGFKAEEWEKLL